MGRFTLGSGLHTNTQVKTHAHYRCQGGQFENNHKKWFQGPAVLLHKGVGAFLQTNNAVRLASTQTHVGMLLSNFVSFLMQAVDG